MEYQDYYKILGIDKNATPDEIKKQYRRLARKYHPDVSKEKDAEDKFKVMKEAYEVLKDPEKRKAYDQVGSQYNAGDQFTRPEGWQYQQSSDLHGQHFNDGDFSDFFADLFGQRARGGRHANIKRPGSDQHATITLTLEEAYHGVQKSMTLSQQSMDHQTGHPVTEQKQLNVKIPAGVTQGQQIRLAGQGAPGSNGGPNGNLYLKVDIKPHAFFQLDKKDVYIQLPITPWEAALGEKIHVPTLGGKISVALPKHAQTGQKMRLKGRGLPGKTAGDQYLILSIHIPEPATEEQVKFYQQMAEKMPFNPRKALFTDI